MNQRVPSQERAEVELIRLGYRKNQYGNYVHPSGATLTMLDMEDLTPFEILREGRRMLTETGRYG